MRARATEPLTAPLVAVEDAGRYQVVLSPRLIIRPETPVVRGTRRSVMPGDVLFKAPLGWLNHARTSAPIKAEVSGISAAVEPGEILRRAIVWSGGDLARFDKRTAVYCQRPKGDFAKSALSALTLGLSDLATRVSKEAQFCLLDADADGRFDHAFLEGLKKPEDRKVVSIEPVGFKDYALGDDAGIDEGDYIQVKLADKAGLFGRSILTEVYLGGAYQTFNGLYWLRYPSPMKLYTPSTQRVPGKEYPQLMNFTNAVVRVHGYDKATKALDIEYLADFSFAPVQLYSVQYIYISY